MKRTVDMEGWVTGQNVIPIIKATITRFAQEFSWHINEDKSLPKRLSKEERITQGINSGLCDLFAEAIKKQIPRAKIIYDEDVDHCYLKIDGHYYDAENPNGASMPQQMRFLGRTDILEVTD